MMPTIEPFLTFKEIYLHANKKAEFIIEFKIHSDELDSEGIKGSLIINTKQIKEIKEYSIKEEFERDQRKYEETLANQIEESLG